MTFLAALGSAAATIGWWLLGWKINDIQAWWFWPLAVVHVLITLMLALITWALFSAAADYPTPRATDFDIPVFPAGYEPPPPPPDEPHCCHHCHGRCHC